MYEFEKHLPKSEAHNIQRIEDKLRQAWVTDPFDIAHESEKLVYLGANKVEANRDKAVFRQMQSEVALNYNPKSDDGITFLEDSGKAINAIRKQDPENLELPQLDLVQKRLEAQVMKFNPEEKGVLFLDGGQFLYDVQTLPNMGYSSSADMFKKYVSTVFHRR
jgi:hypothetical protein